MYNDILPKNCKKNRFYLCVYFLFGDFRLVYTYYDSPVDSFANINSKDQGLYCQILVHVQV